MPDVLGSADGIVLGITEGLRDDNALGPDDGCVLGLLIDPDDGLLLGPDDGVLDGDVLRSADGIMLGVTEGLTDGKGSTGTPEIGHPTWPGPILHTPLQVTADWAMISPQI